MVAVALMLSLATSSIAATMQGGALRTVATDAGGSVWRLALGTRQRTGASAEAWFFVDRRDRRGERLGTSRVRYRFDCRARRALRLERVDLAANGRVLTRSGAQAGGPAARGTLEGKLLDAACG